MAGLPTWHELLGSLSQHLKDALEEDTKRAIKRLLKESRLMDAAEVIRTSIRPRVLRDALVTILDSESFKPTDTHRKLATIPFSAVVTTNYDHLLEEAFAEVRGSRFGRAYTHMNVSALGSLAADKRFFLLKSHGTIEDVESIVFSRSDYQRLMFNYPAYRTFFTSLLTSRTFLFLGYSLSDPDLSLVLEDLAAVFRGFGQLHYALLPCRHRLDAKLTGERFNIQVVPYSPSRRDHPEVTSFLEEICEKLERTKAIEEAERENQINNYKVEAIGKFSAAIGHDLSNILTGVLGYSELLLRELPPDSPGAQRAGQIVQGAERAKRIVRSILAFSGKTPPKTLPISLNSATEHALEMLKAIVPSNVTVARDIATECFVDGDIGQMEQLVMNLFTNACESMPEGGTLSVTVKRDELKVKSKGVLHPLPAGVYALLEIRDTGIGMTKEILDHIFEPFFSGSGSGVGLGLTLVHKTVEALHGDIEVETRPHAGTAFRIILPLSKHPPPSPTTPDDAQPEIMGKGQRIVVIDDEPQITDTLVKLLDSRGYVPKGFVDWHQAIDYSAMPEHGIDLFVLDYVMPGISCNDLVRRLRQLKAKSKILIVTGLPEEQVKQQLESSALLFLQKPFASDQFVMAIQGALGPRKPIKRS